MVHRPIQLALLSAVVALAGAARPSAQDPAAPQQQQQPTFRARIDSVSVDVIVTDRQGRPVTDLTAADFEVRESGKPQTVETFKLIQIEDGRDDPRSARDILSFDDQRRETGRDDNRLLVIFLDDYHTRLGNSLAIRERLAKFVRELTPHDLVAVTTPLMPVTGLTFTRNHDASMQMMLAFQGRKYDYTPKNAMEDRYSFQPPELQERLRNELTISALEGLCMYLGSLRDGRKTILYVSEGMSNTLPAGVNTRGVGPRQPVNSAAPAAGSAQDRMAFFDSVDLLNDMKRVFSAAARANTAIYTLDPRGLATGEFHIDDNVSSSIDRQVLTSTTDLLRTIAGETDGRAIVNRNEPIEDLKRMVRDNSVYYLLGYNSTLAPRDGKFHEIQVRVKRPNVEVRARKGYWALSAEDAERISAPPKAGPPSDVADAMMDLAAIVEPGRRRAVTSWLGAVKGPAEKALVTYAWEGQTVAGTPAVDVVDHVKIVATSISGEPIFSGAVPREDPAGRLAGKVSFEAPPGTVVVRVTAENSKDLRLDTDESRIDVPDFSAVGPKITTPFVFRGRTARDIQMVRASASPLPAASRAFTRTERLLLRFDAYGPAGTTPALKLAMLNRNGDSIVAMPSPTKTAAGPYEAEIGLSALPPGDYLIEISAESNGEIARQLLAIRITG